MENDEASNIAVAYVQRQEQLFVEQIRKTIQLEVSYANLKSKYDESVQHNENNMEMIKQLSASLEALTIERNNLKKGDSQLRDKIDELVAQNEKRLDEVRKESDDKVKEVEKRGSNHLKEYTDQIGNLNTRVNELKTNNETLKKNFDELNSEYQRQKKELQETFNELNKYKKK